MMKPPTTESVVDALGRILPDITCEIARALPLDGVGFDELVALQTRIDEEIAKRADRGVTVAGFGASCARPRGGVVRHVERVLAHRGFTKWYPDLTRAKRGLRALRDSEGGLPRLSEDGLSLDLTTHWDKTPTRAWIEIEGRIHT